MVHLRLVSPPDRTARVVELLDRSAAVINVVLLEGAARKPDGDVVFCDVAREDASVLLHELRELGLHEDGSIAVERVDTAIGAAADEAERSAGGAPADAVVWEEVTSRTSEDAALSGAYLTFMVLAALIAAAGLFLDSAILIVGAMVVGPEFGPLAGLCVAVVQERRELARRSLIALVVGFPLAILSTFLVALALKSLGVVPDAFTPRDHLLSASIARPDFFAFFVAVCAGIAGMLSLTTAKSGALVGVLISVTTIPAAANIAITAAYGAWDDFAGSLGQLAANLGSLSVAGVATLYLQRRLYLRRRERLDDGAVA